MALVRLFISGITGYSAAQRAAAISRELYAVSMPIPLKPQDDAGEFLFAWITHPTTGETVLIAEKNTLIKVHPQKDLSALIDLMPNILEADKAQIIAELDTYPVLPFSALMPSDATELTEQELETNGYYSE